MKDAMLLRDSLAPYIYTHARAAVNTSVSLIHPMYYDDPQADEAYSFAATQYKFGADMFVAPIATAAARPTNGSVSKTVWVPPGEWKDWNNNKSFVGPRTVTLDYGQHEIPVFVRAGAVIPLKSGLEQSSTSSPDLEWNIFPGAAAQQGGVGYVYEDDGESMAYSGGNGLLAKATFGEEWGTAARAWFLIETRGSYTDAPRTRAHRLRVRGFPVKPAHVLVNGVALDGANTSVRLASPSMLDSEVALIIELGAHELGASVMVECLF